MIVLGGAMNDMQILAAGLVCLLAVVLVLAAGISLLVIRLSCDVSKVAFALRHYVGDERFNEMFHDKEF